jgi:type I restriction enzyme, S subunit
MVKTYPKYKDSGAPWIGKVPEYWNVLPTRTLFFEVKERGHIDEQMLSVTISKGVIRQADLISSTSKKDSSNEDKSKYKLVEPGDITYNKMRAWQGAVGVSQYRGIVSPAYIVVRPRRKRNANYFHYLLRTPAFAKEAERWSYGITSDQWSLRAEHFKMIYCPVPSTEEAEAIVKYLAAVNKIIRRYIREKQKVIKLLNEQKQAVINHAITKGVNHNVRLKPSGIDWLGDIPEHWETRRICSCLESIVTGVWGDDPIDQNLSDHIICVRVADFDMLNLKISTKKLTVRAIPRNICQSRLLQQNDILIEKSGGGDAQPVGRVVVHDLKEPAVSSNFISRLRPNQLLMRPLFLLYVLTLLQLRRHNILSIKQTTGIQNLDIKHYFSNWIALPSLGEQDKIINSIESQFESITRVQQLVYRDIELIREYRIRLISDVVTGKVDVRDIKLPEIEDITDSEPIEDQETLEDFEDTEEVMNVDE